LKVGARITSTSGPQPLWDIMKRLAALKGMNISWASDVDRSVLVDVNISAQDDFYLAIDNLLRQVDYYHEVLGSTIIVKYKETRQFHIAMPFIKQTYKTNTGGDVLGGTGGEGSANVAGEISLLTDGVAINNLRDGTPGGIEFNTWYSIENNLNAVLDIWSTEDVAVPVNTTENPGGVDQAESSAADQEETATFRRSKGGNSYFIDKPVGLITVTAPRPLLERLEVYFNSLKRELYKQISIEAKIIEVQLDDHSAIGLNWNKIFESLTIGSGRFEISDSYSKTTTDSENSSLTNTNSYDRQEISTSSSSTGFENTFDSLDTITSGGGEGYDAENTNGLGAVISNDSSQYGFDNLISSTIGSTDSSQNNFDSIINNTIGSVASSGVSAAKIITGGLSSSLGGAISLAAFSFDSFVKAVDEQGETTILSNPKLSVMNGQPSLMTVGRNVTYIDSITSDTDGNTGTITYTVETARALSGVGLALTANILDDNEIILNLVPVTSELVEPIEYRQLGLGEIGLPIISVREISTTVKVKDGEMLVIGGLITSVSSKEDSFIPGTKNIPFFKYLFGYEEKLEKKRELIILLQPRII